MTTIGIEVEHLLKTFPRDFHIAAMVWTEKDIMERAEARRVKLTKEQACDIIDDIDENTDANLGITWDTIDSYLNNFIRTHVEGNLSFLELLKQEFVSSSSLTPQFEHFYKAFTGDMRRFLKGYKATEIKFNKMHFEISGFFRMPSGQIWYLNTGDVRWFKKWMLLRTAKSFEDYTGGSNCQVGYNGEETFISDFERITGTEFYQAIAILEDTKNEMSFLWPRAREA